EVTELDAQRKAFTSRLPKVKAESEAIRNQEARSRNVLDSAKKARAARSVLPPASESSEARSSAEAFHDERRQQQLQELKQTGGAAEGVAAEEEGLREVTLEDFPYRFLDEDQEPEEGVNIYDVEANIAAARAVRAAQDAPPPPPPQHQQQRYDDVTHREARRAAEDTTHQSVDVGQVTTETRAATRPLEAAAPARNRPSEQRLPRRDADVGVVAGNADDAAGGAGDCVSRRERAAAAAALATEWNTPPTGAAPPAVTVMGEGGSGGFVDSAAVERMAREAEEQMEHVSEEDDFFDGDVMGW
ncbi:unnamed protein product, partial [Scytosiphon promiscuus]